MPLPIFMKARRRCANPACMTTLETGIPYSRELASGQAISAALIGQKAGKALGSG
jgi:hypothetical protein